MAQKKKETLEEMVRFLEDVLDYDIDFMKEDWEDTVEEDKAEGIEPQTWEEYVKLIYDGETNWF